MAVTPRQKHQLQPLALDLRLDTENAEQESSHRVLGVAVDHELRWLINIQNNYMQAYFAEFVSSS